MLSDQRVYPTIPTSDPSRLRRFYEEQLGFTPRRETPVGIYYDAGGDTFFTITRTAGRPSGAHTQMAFLVDDIAREVSDLRAKGVVFEEYDLPRLTTVDGIARVPAGQAAWFKDPDANLVGIFEFDET
jgi:catechol 2,3-dioxygenase-like lactoylglutathione lyase family enzyme